MCVGESSLSSARRILLAIKYNIFRFIQEPPINRNYNVIYAT